MEAAQRDPSKGRQRALLTLLFAVFVVLTVGFRLFLVAPAEQRAAASFDNRFSVVWEAWRTVERTEGPSPQVIREEAVTRAVENMALVAEEDPSGISERLTTLAQQPPSSVPEGLGDVWRAWRLLRTDAPDASPNLLARAAIKGLLGSTGDPALQYLSQDEYESARDFFEGDSYEGIGAYVDEIDGVTIIVEPILGGPAEAAGLRSGDHILAVDGQSVEGLKTEEVVALIKGPRGTQVALEVQGPQDAAARTVTVTRDVVPGPSLYTRFFDRQISDERIGYIWLGRFHQGTGEEFRTALQTLLDKGMEGLILDMRWNPGGSLQAATSVASQFLSDGIVMYEVSNDGQRTNWRVRQGGIALNLPLVVLVNGASASAAEVVAGALKDHERARIYGTQTYGKGSVQTFRELSDGSALYLTIAHWYTPDGQLIAGLGIDPDVEVRGTLQDYLTRTDRQLLVAYDALLGLIEAGGQT